MDASTVCSWCNNQKAALIYEVKNFDSAGGSFSLMKCCHCGLVRTEPFLTGAALAEYYTTDYYGSADAKFSPLAEKMVSMLNRFKAKSFYKKFPSGSRCKMLDVGPGRGAFLASMGLLGVECYGVERAEFPQNDDLPFTLYRGDLKDLSLPLGSFDAVTMWHVLEHLENPREMIEQAVLLLKPGALLLVAVPNFSSWQSRWFGSSWFHLDVPRHLHHFSADWLTRQFDSIGVVEKVATLPTVEQSLFGFIQSFQNMVLPGVAPNKLYKLLQRRKGSCDLVLLFFLTLFGAILLPFACVEHVFSALSGHNASIVLTVKKPLEFLT